MFRSSPTERSWGGEGGGGAPSPTPHLSKVLARKKHATMWAKRTHRLAQRETVAAAAAAAAAAQSDQGSDREAPPPPAKASSSSIPASPSLTPPPPAAALRPVEDLPCDVYMEVLAHLSPPEIVSFLNSSPSLRRRLDTKELWKACWYWMADEFSGAVSVNRLLCRAELGKAFDWKMLVLLDWRFQCHDLTYKSVRSSAKEWCARIREVGLVLNVQNTQNAIFRLKHLLHSLTRIDEDETASTEDEYDHDKGWEMAIVSGMALASVRRDVIGMLDLPKGLNLDRLPEYYESAFAYYRDLVADGCSHTDTDTDMGF